MKPVLEQCREQLRELVMERGLDRAEIKVLAKPLTPEEAIGNPDRRDFPIVEGKERVIEALVDGARGQAFTDTASNFQGAVGEVIGLALDNNRNRAVFIAAMNAVLRRLGMVEGTLHCKDNDPEICARELAQTARKAGAKTVGLIGLNPAIAEALAAEFGADSVWITDLNRDNIGKKKFGVEILDGRTRTGEMVRAADLLFITGTTLVNGTFDGLWELIRREGKQFYIFGVTAAGVCRLLDLPRVCPCARS